MVGHTRIIGCDSTSVWYDWNNTYTTLTTSDPWPEWANLTTFCDNTTVIWNYWCDGTSTYTTQIRAQRYVAPQPTAAELKAAKKAADDRQQERVEAETRALTLLLDMLTEQQRDEFQKYRHFTVHGRNWRYRIRKGHAGNVDVVDKNGIISHRLCAHPSYTVPDFDAMLAQKLMLEDDEDSFLSIANRHQPAQTGERVLEPA